VTALPPPPPAASRQAAATPGWPLLVRSTSARAAEFLAFLFGPIAFFAPLGLAPLFAFFAVVAAFETSRAEPFDALAPLRRWMPVWPLVAWAAISAGWALAVPGALIEAAKLAAEAWGGYFALRFAAGLPPERRARLLEAAAVGMALGAALALADGIMGGRLTMWGRGKAVFSREFYSRGAAVAGILVVPLTLALAGRRRWGVAMPFVALTGAAVVLFVAASAKLALAAGLLGAAAAALSKPSIRLLALAALAIGIATPVLVRVEIPPEWGCRLVAAKASAAHRLAIWHFVSEHIPDHPIVGWGLDASRALPGGQATVRLESCPDPAGGPLAVDAVGNVLPLHPHNAALQVWLELGLVGVALTSVLALWAMGRASRLVRTGRDAAIVGATTLSLFAVEFVSFGVWQAWWICAALMVAAFARAALSDHAASPS
jgi:O-antigen ligase